MRIAGDTDNTIASMQPSRLTGMKLYGNMVFNPSSNRRRQRETHFHSVRRTDWHLLQHQAWSECMTGYASTLWLGGYSRITPSCGKRAVIPVTDVVETVRHLVGGSETVGRDAYKLVQTPQVFDADLLKQAYEQPYTSHFTDDASVVEALGKPVYLTEGNRENIKITTPFDLKICRPFGLMFDLTTA